MDRTHLILFVLLNLCSVIFAFGGGGEFFYQQQSPVIFDVPMNSLPMVQPQFHPMARDAVQGYPKIPQEQVPQESLTPVLHTMSKSASPTPETTASGNSKLNSGQTGMTQRDDDYYRAGKSGYEYPTHQSSYSAPSYGFTSPSSSYNSAPVPASSPSYPPAVHHSSTSKFSTVSFTKPDLAPLIKPPAPLAPLVTVGATSKVASKISGLISLVLTLLTGSSADDFEMKGFKDIVIDGIVKPLLLAKSGIKSLISKLTIPLISLLLINLEVLVTIWWLWEDCPQSTKPVYSNSPTYQNPTAVPNYNYSYPNL